MSSTGVREDNSGEKRSIRGLIKNEEAFIQSLKVFANTSTVGGLGASGSEINNSPNEASGNFMARSGDFWIGQVGNNYNNVAATELVSDTLDVSKTNGVTDPVVILQGEGLADDDLVTIVQGEDVYPFQELIIRTRINTITVKNSGNVNTPNGGDMVLPPGSIIHLFFDTFLGEWVIDSGTSFLGGGGNVPVGTVENQHLEWNNSTLVWEPVDAITLGSTGPFGDSGFIRTANDQIIVSARNAADDGNMEFKVNSADFFDFTDSGEQPVVLQVRAQHPIDPDQIMQFIQLSGSGAVSEQRAPTAWSFFATSVNVMQLDQNKIDVNKNILPIAGDGVLRIGNNTAPNRFLGVHAAEFGIDINSRLNFTTGGTTTINQGTSLTVLIGGGQRVLITSSITQLTGNVDVLANLGIGGYADIAEISVPGNPAANIARMYAKDVSSLTRLFYRDTLGTEISVGMSFVGFAADADLDMNTFDVFDIDSLTFMSSSGTLSSLNVGFSSLGSGGFRANVLNGGDFEITEENILHFSFDGGLNSINVIDALFNVHETSGDTSFSIAKFNGRTDLSEPTEMNLQIAGFDIATLTSSGITMADNKFIANVDQLGFRNLGNLIEDDANGVIFTVIPTKEFTWDDGTTEFAILDIDGLFLNALFIQNTSITAPAATGFANVGRVFFDEDNDDHYSVRRDGDVIDLEGGLDSDSYKVYDQTIENPFNEETWYGLEINSAFNADVYDVTMTVGDMWLAPMILTKATTINGLGIYADTSVSGSQYVIGIYEDIGAGRLRPNSKIVQAITPTSSVRFEPVNISAQDLSPGIYWMAIKCTANPASVGKVRAIPYSMMRPILGYGDNDDGDEATFIGPGLGYLINGLGTSTTLPATITATDLGKLESGGGSSEATDVFPNIFTRYTKY